MKRESVSVSAESVRRLAIAKQHLAGKLPARATSGDILSTVRDTCYVQWDPIAAIAPSHLIALYARVGRFRVHEVEKLLWKEKRMFYHWTPVAMLVLMEDYPLYYSLMRRYPASLTKSWGQHAVRARKFLSEHRELRKRMLDELKSGPLLLTQFKDYVRTKRSDDGWSSGSDVSAMLSHLHMSGEVMVVGHDGIQNLWGLSEDFLPDWVEKRELPHEEVDREAALRTIGALGTASPSEMYRYFIRGRFKNLKGALETLADESRITSVEIEGQRSRDGFYMLSSDLKLLESIEAGDWYPRMSLLAHFDNMVAVRDWLKRVFGFEYIHEQFLPKNKRKYGTFVLPILWGDRIIGRLEPRMDRENERLIVSSVHAEPGAPATRSVSSLLASTVEQFSEFLGAKEVVYTSSVPSAWKSYLH